MPLGSLELSFGGRRPPWWLWAGLGGAAALAVAARALDKGTTVGPSTMPSASSRDFATLHPQFQPIALDWSARMARAGLDHVITFTYRTLADQARLKREKKSKVDFGYHNAGLAFDFTVKVDGRAVNTDTAPRDLLVHWAERMRQAGVIGENLGMVWGGRWTPLNAVTGLGWDPFHLEWHPGLTIAQTRLKLEAEGWGFRVV